ncbi:MAG TPA: CDP-alcohol phosphatidyltransferase family protein [Spirochaetota bacterium]|nr:CDP-alcohol phosphatidyltransferase family protein [Spirochaetota bacterium]HPS86865.1 CDP-alcohol phosphatidyltransferase family protein [Spirochaetota bacterium]
MKIRYLFREKVFTVSNFLTFSRIIVVPIVTYYMYMENVTGNSMYRIHQFIFFLIIVMSDFFDGFLARAFDQVSQLGQFLDPVADKICLLCIGGSLVYYKDFPLWMLIIGLCRELFFVVSALFLFYRRDVEVKPNMLGKTSVACMAFSAIIYLLSFDYMIFPHAGVKELSILLILVFYISGSILYVKTYSVHYFKKVI